MLAVLAFVAAASMGADSDARDVAMSVLPNGASVTIDAMPYARTVTCSDYTLTGTASGPEAVTWSASPSGASGACTGTTSWSCVVDVAPDAVGEGVEVITVTQGTLTDTETIGFYVDGEHSCWLSQNVNGAYNSGLSDLDAVATWENLGSSALDVTQGTGSAQPTFRTSIVGGQPVVRCDGGDGLSVTTGSDFTYLSNGTDSTIEIIFATSSSNPDAAQTLLSTQTTVANASFIGTSIFHDDRVSVPREDRSLWFTASGAGLPTQVVSGEDAAPGGRYNLLQNVLDDNGGAGDDAFQYVNGAVNGTWAAATAYSASAPAARLTFCRSFTANLPYTGDLFRVLIYQSALDATQRGINEAVDEWALNGTLPVVAASETWLFIGDSITAGAFSVTPWPSKLVVADTFMSNQAIAGSGVSGMLTAWNANKSPPPARVFVLGGVNNINSGTAGATVFTTLEDIYQDAQALGVDVTAITVLPYGNNAGWNAGEQTQLTTLNGLISGSVDVDRVVDLYTIMGEPGTPEDLAAIYDNGDGLHPNGAGTTEMAAEVTTALGL